MFIHISTKKIDCFEIEEQCEVEKIEFCLGTASETVWVAWLPKWKQNKSFARGGVNV